MASTLVWHLITGEYPPQPGGVSDYTAQVAAGLAHAGDEVHVWCPPAAGITPAARGVTVHRILGDLGPAAWTRLGRELDAFPPPRRLLVQWMPHAFGWRSLNVPFCWWLSQRAARRHDRVEIMVHEAFLAFGGGSWRQTAAAVVHRLMTVLILRAASRVWISVPPWEQYLRPYLLGRRLQFHWLPVPANVPVRDDPVGAANLRARLAGPDALVGHFGCGALVIGCLKPAAFALLAQRTDVRLLLLGHGSAEVRQAWTAERPDLARRLLASGPLPADTLSLHLQACDLFLQAFPDGVSSRRTTAMAVLAHGKPLVTTTGHMTEPFWSEDGAAVLAPVGDTEALVHATERLLDERHEREQVARVGAERYRSHFDLGHLVSRLRADALLEPVAKLTAGG